MARKTQVPSIYFESNRMDAEIGTSIPANTPGSVRAKHADDCLCDMCRAYRRCVVKRAARKEAAA